MGRCRRRHRSKLTVKHAEIIFSWDPLITCFISPGLGAFPTVVSLIFVTLFFGGCIIPAATGVIMESSPPEARPEGAAGRSIKMISLCVCQCTYLTQPALLVNTPNNNRNKLSMCYESM